jgi:DNA-binding protein H-NS
MLNRNTVCVMKQRDCNFDSMSNSELWDLYTELGSKLTAKLEAEATLLQTRLDELQRRADATAPACVKAKRRGAVAAKFRNPHRPFQTWSGRGPQPRWLKEALSHGETLDSLRIQALVPRQAGEAYPA